MRSWSRVGKLVVAMAVLAGAAVLLLTRLDPSAASSGGHIDTGPRPEVSVPMASRVTAFAQDGEQSEHAASPPSSAARTEAVAASPDRGSLSVLVTTTGKDGGRVPLKAEPVLVAQARGREWGEFRRRGETNGEGKLVIHGLAAGRWMARSPDSTYHPVDVRAGEVSHVHLGVARFAVSGVVVDARGRPVFDAEVWLSDRFTTVRGRVVARTDDVGRFQIASVGELRSVAARAEGFSFGRPMPIVPDRAGEDVDVRLVLGDRAVRLEGAVVDAEGRPVAGATVSVGQYSEDRMSLQIEPGKLRERMPELLYLKPPPVMLLTDERGQFATACVARGTDVPVFAVADGFGITSLQVALPSEPLTVELSEAVVVRGTVRSADGSPCAGVAVNVGRWDRHRHPLMDRQTVFTSSAGSYEALGLTAGEIPISVSDGELGTARAQLRAAPGDTLAWDPVLDTGLVVAGRLLDASGSPRVGWTVHAWGVKEEGQHERTRKTDAAGRFRFIHCSDVPYNFTVHDPREFVSMPIKLEQGYRPGLLDPSGKPARANAGVSYQYGSKGRVVEGDCKMGPLLPGRYRFSFYSERYAPIEADEVELGAGEILSLGTLRFREYGSLSHRGRGRARGPDRSAGRRGEGRRD